MRLALDLTKQGPECCGQFVWSNGKPADWGVTWTSVPWIQGHILGFDVDPLYRQASYVYFASAIAFKTSDTSCLIKYSNVHKNLL
jgi:hypothetical protein